MWGRHIITLINHLFDRNTPTHVGKTKILPVLTNRRRKHPHACGEDDAKASLTETFGETPPRMWGRLQYFPGDDDDFRNTPTHVGKTHP